MIKQKPSWLKMKQRDNQFSSTENYLASLHLHTVCQEAHCPNQNECFSHGTATFMILGKYCTRNCTFCAVLKRKHPFPLDPSEPENVAQAVEKLGLQHAVVTSVTRDDLEDGGANQFAETIQQIRQHSPSTTIEVLIPDFLGHHDSLDIIIQSKPEVVNHNIETLQKLYPKVRPEADYHRSLEVLSYIKKKSTLLTKSGFMVGLGETPEDIQKLMEDLVSAGCDILTIGQYLQPSLAHFPVYEYVPPSQFENYRKMALKIGFKHVESGPLVRSSYHAKESLGHVMEGR
ncbi:MAG: lipoyl synthase [Caldisericia bacterium]|nr:lipoyl synthase [Caldisericia bacterium]MDD4613916.1 lipoyl synthase [Caldisericia bacterium]